MRLGVVLAEPFAEDAARVEAFGFDLAWVDESSTPAPLVTAAALAASTSSPRLAAAVTAGAHPILLAEEAAVADLSCHGRLVLVLASDEAALLRETVELLFRAWAARPFRHDGPRWSVPAGLPEHENAELQVRVTPAPEQLEPTVWLAGQAAVSVAAEFGLAPVGESEATATAFWTAAERDGGPAALRARRPHRLRVEADAQGRVEPAALIGRLRAERDAWGADVAILELPPGLTGAARERALGRIATAVAPAIALDRVPRGLSEYWEGESADA